MATESDDVSLGVLKMVDLQLETQGIATVKHKDGQTFIFTAELLKKLISRAEQHPKKIVLVLVKLPDVGS